MYRKNGSVFFFFRHVFILFISVFFPRPDSVPFQCGILPARREIMGATVKTKVTTIRS
jgi:hypothetical protein